MLGGSYEGVCGACKTPSQAAYEGSIPFTRSNVFSAAVAGQNFRLVINALTVMPTESLPRAKAGVGIHASADSSNRGGGWWVCTAMTR